MKKIPKRYWFDFVGIVIIIIVYFILYSYCANNDVVSQMLSGGAKSSSAVIAVIFIAMRLFIILILPGCILARIGLLTHYLYFQHQNRDDQLIPTQSIDTMGKPDNSSL